MALPRLFQSFRLDLPWVEDLLAALRTQGAHFSMIPHVINGGQIENRIKEFGEQSKAAVLNRKLFIESAGDLPLLDVRMR